MALKRCFIADISETPHGALEVVAIRIKQLPEVSCLKVGRVDWWLLDQWPCRESTAKPRNVPPSLRVLVNEAEWRYG